MSCRSSCGSCHSYLLPCKLVCYTSTAWLLICCQASHATTRSCRSRFITTSVEHWGLGTASSWPPAYVLRSPADSSPIALLLVTSAQTDSIHNRRQPAELMLSQIHTPDTSCMHSTCLSLPPCFFLQVDPYFCYLVVAMQLAVYAAGTWLAVSHGPEAAEQWAVALSLQPQEVLSHGENWRLATSLLLHGGIAHLTVDTAFLGWFGPGEGILSTRTLLKLLGSVGCRWQCCLASQHCPTVGRQCCLAAVMCFQVSRRCWVMECSCTSTFYLGWLVQLL